MRDLYNCVIGREYHINKLLLDKSECVRLRALGLNENALVCVSIKNTNGVIVTVRGVRIAISKRLSRRIVTK